MKQFDFPNNIFNIQKCSLPSSNLTSPYLGRFVAVQFDNVDIICKVGSSYPPTLGDGVSFDKSVRIIKSSNWAVPSTDVDLKQIEILEEPELCESVEVSVVFTHVNHMHVYRNSKIFLKTLKDILKLFVFRENCVIFLGNLPATQNLNIKCLIVGNTVKRDGSKKCLLRVSLGTRVVVKRCVSALKHKQENTLAAKTSVCVKSSYVTMLNNLLSLHLSKQFESQNALLVGPSGCGKSTLIQQLVHARGCVLYQIQLSDIQEALPGEAERKIKEELGKVRIHEEHGERCVVVLDHVEVLGGRKASLHSARLLHELSVLIQGLSDSLVIATCNSLAGVNETLLTAGVFQTVIEMGLPTEDERADMIQHLLATHNIEANCEVVKKAAQWTPGYVAADLCSLLFEARLLLAKGYSVEDALKRAASKMVASTLRGSSTLLSCRGSRASLSDIGGLTEVKTALLSAVSLQLNHPHVLAKFNLEATKGVLLYGPPGCAKTSLVRALASETNSSFFAVSAADLYSPFVGDAEAQIIQLFAQARLGAPAIIFIDEIDALVGSKGGSRERGVQERVLSTLLVEMDGVGIKMSTGCSKSCDVIVIAATNRPDLLDDALKRPGRFDKLLYIPAPDEMQRRLILTKVTEGLPLDVSVDLYQLAASTEFFSGADLKGLATEAALHALSCHGLQAELVHMSDFQSVLTKLKPSLTLEAVEFYEKCCN